MSDKRSYQRIKLVNPVEIVSISSGEPISEGIIIDISASGIGVIGSEKLQPGIFVSIRAELPSELKLNGLKGQIVRSDPIGDTKYVFIGIDFGELMPDKRQQLSKYVIDLRFKQYSHKIGM